MSEGKKKGRVATGTLPMAEREDAVLKQCQKRLALLTPEGRVDVLEFLLRRERRGVSQGEAVSADDRQMSIEGA